MFLAKFRAAAFLHWFVLLNLVVGLAGCQALPFGFEPTATTPPPTPESEATATQPQPTLTPTSEAPGLLRLWLPPQFNPDSGTTAGDIFKQRLEAFSLLHPDVQLEIRLKAENGPGGLLPSLSTASVAAPGALPDVVALPRSLLEAAALKGILHPLDGMTNPLDAVDWYPYAVELGYVQEKVFGLPFSADLMVLVATAASVESLQAVGTVEPASIGEPTAQPTAESEQQQASWIQWQELMQSGQTLAFPAGDPQAVFTLLLYRSAGGPLFDVEGRPMLEEDPLAQTLTIYQQAAQAGVLPAWLTQIETDEQSLEALVNGQADKANSWLSRYIAETSPFPTGQTRSSLQGQVLAEQIPTLSGEPYTLATGWVWSVASPDPAHRELAEKLVEFLAESSFLAEWNAALGYLPPRPDALTEWTVGFGESAGELRNLAADLSAAASLQPSEDVLAVLGPPIRQAVVNVINLQVEPEVAAKSAVASLNLP